MQRYDFEVLAGDQTIRAERSIALTSARDAWRRILKLARRAERADCRIRVTDQSGSTLILIGVLAALRSLDTRSANA